jgi:hypothetical protein
MSVVFKRFINALPKKKIFIFDLDKTIWDCTIEEDLHIRENEIINYIKPERYSILNYLQEKGHEINIGSRSSEPELCKKYLTMFFPNIKFNSIQIYPTSESKRKHVDAIFSGRNVSDFYFFDDELNILEDLKKQHPKHANILHTPNGVSYETFRQRKYVESLMFK